MWDEAQPARSNTALAAAMRNTRAVVMASPGRDGIDHLPTRVNPVSPPPGIQVRPPSAHAAVDADHLAGDVGGGVGAQEAHYGGDFVRGPGAPGGHHLLHRLGREGG